MNQDMFSNVLYLDPERIRQLRIPLLTSQKYFNAFNCSIVKGIKKNEYVIAFRYSNFSPTENKTFPDLPFFESKVGILFVDNNFDICRAPFIIDGLNVSIDLDNIFYGYEDPRIFVHDSVYYLLCNRFFKDSQSNKMYLAKLTSNFQLDSILSLDPPFPRRSEKNWVALPHNHKLYVKYSLDPDILLNIDPDSGFVTTAHIDNRVNPNMNFAVDFFLSGGSSLIPYNGSEYIGIAHIAHFVSMDVIKTYLNSDKRDSMLADEEIISKFNADSVRNYYSVFYTVSSSFPFKLMRKSGPVKFINQQGTYEDVQYVSGICYSDNEDGFFISYGVNDRSMNLIEIKTETVERLLSF